MRPAMSSASPTRPKGTPALTVASETRFSVIAGMMLVALLDARTQLWTRTSEPDPWRDDIAAYLPILQEMCEHFAKMGSGRHA